MSSSINLSLTDELRSFVNENGGDGSLYATPSRFILGQHRNNWSISRLRTLSIRRIERQ